MIRPVIYVQLQHMNIHVGGGKQFRFQTLCIFIHQICHYILCIFVGLIRYLSIMPENALRTNLILQLSVYKQVLLARLYVKMAGIQVLIFMQTSYISECPIQQGLTVLQTMSLVNNHSTPRYGGQEGVILQAQLQRKELRTSIN